MVEVEILSVAIAIIATNAAIWYKLGIMEQKLSEVYSYFLGKPKPKKWSDES